jgi:hypothetical protein
MCFWRTCVDFLSHTVHLTSCSDHEGGNVSAHTGHLVIFIFSVVISDFLLVLCRNMIAKTFL